MIYKTKIIDVSIFISKSIHDKVETINYRNIEDH